MATSDNLFKEPFAVRMCFFMGVRIVYHPFLLFSILLTAVAIGDFKFLATKPGQPQTHYFKVFLLAAYALIPGLAYFVHAMLDGPAPVWNIASDIALSSTLVCLAVILISGFQVARCRRLQSH